MRWDSSQFCQLVRWEIWSQCCFNIPRTGSELDHVFCHLRDVSVSFPVSFLLRYCINISAWTWELRVAAKVVFLFQPCIIRFRFHVGICAWQCPEMFCQWLGGVWAAGRVMLGCNWVELATWSNAERHHPWFLKIVLPPFPRGAEVLGGHKGQWEMGPLSWTVSYHARASLRVSGSDIGRMLHQGGKDQCYQGGGQRRLPGGSGLRRWAGLTWTWCGSNTAGGTLVK